MPALTGFNDALFLENTVNATPQLLDADVVFTDAEGDFNGGTLTLSGLLAEDTVSVRNQGSGAGQIGLSGVNVSFGGVVIGTLNGGAGAILTITFNAAATSAAIYALIQNLTYANSSDTPTATRNLVLNVTDAAGTSVPSQAGYHQLIGASNPLGNPFVGSYSAPAFVDLDGDGDLDVVIGSVYGTLRSFKNAGTGFVEMTGVNNPFNGFDVGNWSTPTFTDLDNDGDQDAVVGAQSVLDLELEAGDQMSPKLRASSAPRPDEPLSAVINGTAGADGLSGTASADVINGLGGDDLLVGLDDDDVLNGGDNNDTLVGGRGNDVLDGGNGIDTADYSTSTGDGVELRLYTGAGDDLLGFAVGSDTLISIENVTGTGYTDIIYGDANANVLNGLGSMDFLFGMDGDDTISGGSGNDVINGGNGNDIIDAGDGDDGQQQFFIGTFYYDGISGGAGDDTIYGGAGNDGLFGGDNNDVLYGGDGIDGLTGGAGADLMYGDAGNDVLSFEGGDTGYGGADNDTMQIYGSDMVLVDGGTGLDTLVINNVVSLGPVVDIDLTQMWGGGDGIIGAGGVIRNIERLGAVTGSNSNDTIIVGNGYLFSVTMNGEAGDDELIGGGADDTLHGGVGADALNGGNGIDTATYDEFFSPAGVTVNLLTGMGSGSNAQGDTYLNIENVTGTGNSDTLIGDAGANRLIGLGGDDVMEGGDGADTLRGDSLDDVLLGAEGGDDNLSGGAGADFLDGGANNDILDGGTGNDILEGDRENDILSGGDGDDSILGGFGADLLEGGLGADTLDGGLNYAGQTTNGTAEIAGGPGDTASYAGSNAAVTVNLATGTGSGGHAQGDTLTAIENLIGSAFNDSLTGDAGANNLTGGAGGDALNGGGGIDTAYYDGSSIGVRINLATNLAAGGDAAGDVLTNIENLVGSAFNDTLTGNAGVNLIRGGDGTDTLSGMEDNDVLKGGWGADSHLGGVGIDTAHYGLTSLTEYTDIAGFHLGSAVTVAFEDLQAYFDSIMGDTGVFSPGVTVNLQTGLGSGGHAQGDTYNSIENVIGTINADTLIGDSGNNVLTGDLGADTIDGGGGTDTADYSFSSFDFVFPGLFSSGVTVNLLTGVNTGGAAQGDVLTSIENLIGTAYNDVLTGDGANNTLTGGGGLDTLNGGDGDDFLDGGDGNDNLNGGSGSDTAVFSGNRASYTISTSGGITTIIGPGGTDTLSNVERLRFADGLFGIDGIQIGGLTGFGPSVVFAENTVNGAPQLLDADVVFYDIDGDYDGGFLTLSGLLAQDTVSVRNEGSGTGQIGRSGADVSFGGVVIGTLVGGAGSTLTISFNAAATPTAIDALIQNLTYANSSDTPTANRNLRINITDAAGNDLGASGALGFIRRFGAANPMNGVNVGVVSEPALADLDGDGDLDAVIGSGYGVLNYFENTGTASAAVFTQRTGAANPFDGVDIGNNTTPAFGDLDGDGDLDLVVGEGDGTINYFENTGTTSAPVFIQRTGAANPFNDIGIILSDGISPTIGMVSAPTLGDLDGDGDLDALVGEVEGFLRYLENTGTTSAPVFIERTGAANPFNGIDLGILSNPTFVDLDGDGDLDAMIGESDGTLNYFENTGTTSAPVFVQRTGAANPFNTVDVGNVSAPSFGDLDGDGDLEALVGTNQRLDYFQNITGRGQVITVSVTAEDEVPTGPPVLTDFGPSVIFAENTVNTTPQLLDADVTFTDIDGDYDGGILTLSGLLAEDTVSVRDEGSGAGQIGLSGAVISYGGVVIGTLAGGAGSTLTIIFNAAATPAAIDALIQNLTYANISQAPTANRDLVINITDAAGNDLQSAIAPGFTGQTGATNPFNDAVLGEFNTPVLADLDDDGDLDAVIGDLSGALRYFENTGSDTAPVFVQQTGAANPFNGVVVGAHSAPAMADLDGDGDLDAVVGRQDGTLLYFENSGSASNPVFIQQSGTANPFDGMQVFFNSTPTFADLDGDGDLDALVGDNSGELNFFENSGTASSPVFSELTGASNPFDGFDVGSHSTPTFIDLDGDGDFDAVVGERDGHLYYFENTGTTTVALFTAITGGANPFNSLDLGSHTAPAFADLDGDGDPDAVIGERVDVFYSLAGGQSITVTVTPESDAPILINFGPSVTFAENTVNASPQLLDADVTFIDSDGDYDGGTLTLSGLLAEDRVSVRNQGSGAGQIGLLGANVSFGGVVIGTLSGGVGATLTITFNAAATPAAIDALIQNLTYGNVSSTPTASRDLVINITDAAGHELGAANPFDGLALGEFNTPALADLDGDGDLDALVGENSGLLFYFENTGSAAAPVFTPRTGAANPFNGIDVVTYSAPVLVDLDGDGDMDAVMGQGDGALLYFENIGGPSTAVFAQRTGAANPFDGISFVQNSAPAFADLDGDGDMDMIVGENSGELSYFENTGSAMFVERTGSANPFDGFQFGYFSIPVAADLDGDGDLDVIVGERDGVLNYFENTGSASAPAFVQRTGAANPFDGFDPGSHTAPFFADLNDDGILDAVIGDRDEARVYLGSVGSGFDFASATAGGQTITVNITEEADVPVLTDLECEVAFAENLVNATPQLLDADVVFTDGDNDYDDGTLTLSGLLTEDRVSVRNQGSGAGQVGLSGANVSFGGVVIGTLTGGVGTDLTITFNAAATSPAIDAVIQNLTYGNVSNTPTVSRDLVINITDEAGNDLGTTQRFTQRTGAANPLNGVDVGVWSSPAFADLDADGDLDAVFGGDPDNGGPLNVFENIGTTQDPNFVARTGIFNPFDGYLTHIGAPTFADLDDDGDLDAVVGDYNGDLIYFENTGAASAPDFTQRTGAANPLGGFDVGSLSNPTFADLDGDGDLDALVGVLVDTLGALLSGSFNFDSLHYLENIGTAAAPVFAHRTGVASPFYGLNQSVWSAPTFADIDGDGDSDVVVGGPGGALRYYENTGTVSAAAFTQRTGAANPFNCIDVGDVSSPTFADLDGDGDLDLIVGEYDGTVNYFENTMGHGQVITVTVTPEQEPLIGGNVGDVLHGTFLDDAISGLGGDDFIQAGGGNDQLQGGAGNDALFGGDGIDTADYSDAGVGVAVNLGIVGRSQNTLGSGRDMLSGIENLSGSAFGDTLTGDAGDNVLSDTLGGNDRLVGGAGNDALMVERIGIGDLLTGSSISLIGGTGDDAMTFNGHDRYTDTVVVEGQDGADHFTLIGCGRANINMGAGDDRVTIDTLGGTWSIKLGSGMDTIALADTGGAFMAGADNVVRDFAAGAGGDKWDLTAWLGGEALPNFMPGSNPFLDGHMRLVQAGRDTLLQIDRDGGGNSFETLAMMQNTMVANFTAANFTAFGLNLAPLPAPVEGGAGPDNLTGTAGIDVLNGGGGDDRLSGGGAGDTLNGGSGNDILEGGEGDDFLNGGSGGLGDTATYATASAGVNVNLGISGQQNTGGSGFDSLTGIEHLIGSVHTDELRGDGFNNRLTDTLGGNDFLRGEGGADTILITRSGAGAATTVRLNGGADNDTLTFAGGGRYADTVTLEGEAGNDLITVSGAATINIDAGAGDDTVIYDLSGGVHRMTLGTGVDTIRLTGGQFQGSGDNLVRDFVTGAGGDIVDLTAYLAGAALTNYTGGSNPFGDGHMRLIQAGSRTVLQVDRDGGGNGYQTLLTFANTTVAAFTAANFNGIDPTGAAPAPLQDGDKDAGPQVWVQETGTKAPMPEVLPGIDDEEADPLVWGPEALSKEATPEVLPGVDDHDPGGTGGVRTSPGQFGGGSDPWVPLTLDGAGDGFLTVTGGLNPDEGEPLVLPGEPVDDLPEPADLFGPFPVDLSGFFAGTADVNGLFPAGSGPGSHDRDAWLF